MKTEQGRYSLLEIIDSSLLDYRQDISKKQNIKDILSDINQFCYKECIKFKPNNDKHKDRFILNKKEEQCILECAKYKINCKDSQITHYKNLFIE